MTDFRGAASEGTRAANLIKKREKQREELERLKKKIQEVSRTWTVQVQPGIMVEVALPPPPSPLVIV